MSNDQLLTDDYVAGLLAQEANDCSLKYSAMGMEAFNTQSKTANLPKPNTRFLRHIIKDTDAHNKALLAKEAAESRARLKDLEDSEETKRQKTNPNSKDIRRRQLGDIQSILGGRERDKRATDIRISQHHSHRGRDSRKSQREEELKTDRRRDRRDYGRLSRSPHEDRGSKRSVRGEESQISRRHRRDSAEDDKRRRRDRTRNRSRSPHRRRSSRSPKDRRGSHRHRSPLANEKIPRDVDKKRDDDNSDAPEDFIGPAPPPKYRGRGTIGGSLGLDRRFSDSYDPKDDIMQDNDTWDDAVEAYRDRKKLLQNQEGRMKEAGFSAQQIQKLATHSPREKTEDDVVWSKAGQKREWDRGKEDVDNDGDANLLVGIFSEDK